MDKRGVLWEDLADLLLGGSILFIAITTYLLITGLHSEKVTLHFQEKTGDVNQDEMFVSYLSADIDDGKTLADLIAASRINDNDEVSVKLDNFLKEIYSKKVCWVLSIDNKEWLRENSCRIKESLMDGSATSSFPDKAVHRLELKISGYADE